MYNDTIAPAPVSKAYGGRIDDVELAKICGLLDLVEEGDVSLADRGFILRQPVEQGPPRDGSASRSAWGLW